MESSKMPNITLSMPKEEQDRLKASAKKLRQSISQHVLYLLDEYERKRDKRDYRTLGDVTQLGYELDGCPTAKDLKEKKKGK